MSQTLGFGGGGVILQSTQEVTSNTTLTSGSNYASIGPVITIASGVTVVVNSGVTWSILD